MDKINKTKTCWIWTGENTEKGYGRIYIKGKKLAAHRYFYEQTFGPIPKGLEIDHKCRVRNCVNPKHLEAITHRENVKRGWAERIKTKTHCPNGHPYSGDNLYTYTNKTGKTWRMCKKCRLRNVLKCIRRKKLAN